MFRFFHKISTRKLRWKVLKTVAQVLSYVVSIQSKKIYGRKRNTQKKIYGRKARTFCFQKKQVFQLCLIFVLDLLSLISWEFRFEIFTKHSLLCVIDMWLRFELQIRSTRYAIHFLFNIVTNERMVCFYVKLFDHFITEYLSIWERIY